MNFFAELKRRNVLRVGAAYAVLTWLLVQIVTTIEEPLGLPDWVDTFIIVLLAIGFPLVLLFSWAYELTPGGLKTTKEVDRDDSITHNTGRRLDRAIIVVLLIAVGYFVWERETYRSEPVPDANAPVASASASEANGSIEEIIETASPDARSIAVLPFVNMSSDEEQEWFADGLTEEILNALARTPGLLVAARTSSFGFKRSTRPIPEIADELGVAHVLEGSVRRGGDTLRVTAQLIRAEDGFHVWSETFDRRPEDIIAIQEEIAVRIADALEIAMDPDALADMRDIGTESIDAYGAFLTGMGALNDMLETGDAYAGLQAIGSLERAVDVDPEFARAYAWINRFWYMQTQTSTLGSGISELPIEEQKRRRDEALQNAIQYEDDPGRRLDYRVRLATIQLDFQLAARLARERLDAGDLEGASYFELLEALSIVGAWEEAASFAESMYEELDFDTGLVLALAQKLRAPGYEKLMVEIGRRAAREHAKNTLVMYQAHRLLLWGGDVDTASGIASLLQTSDLSEDARLNVLLRQYCAESKLDEARGVYEKLVELYPTRWITHGIYGDLDVGAEIFREADESGDFETIGDYLGYAYFDATVYPNFMKAMEGQGLENRELLLPPYRCLR